MRRFIGAMLIIIGAGAFAACLRAALAGVRDVMIKDGGSCGSGGPYVIAQQCSSGDIRLLLVGILGGLVAVVIYGSGSAALSRSAPSAGLLAWAGGFGAFGWNFLSLVIHPPAGQGRSIGYLISGIVFLALALGGLAPLLSGLISDVRSASRPGSASGRIGPSIVPAVIPPGLGAAPPVSFGGWSPSGTTALGVTGTVVDAVPPRVQLSALTGLEIWLVTSAIGAAIGLILSSSLINLLN